MKTKFDLSDATADNLGIGLFKYELAPDERFTVVNSTLPQMLGFPSKMEFKNELLSSFFTSPADLEAFFSKVHTEGRVKFFETRFRTRSGDMVWVAVTASKITASARHVYLEGIIENINAHKETEERLAREMDIVQGLLDNIPDAIYFKDNRNRIIKVNDFYARGMGITAEAIIGKTDFDFFPPEQAEHMFADDNYVMQTGQPIVGKIERTLLPNGTWNQVITTKIPMSDRTGAIMGTMGITRDMTAYAHSEQERLSMLTSALTVLEKTLELRDPYTFTHNHRVACISERIGRHLGFDENRLLGIRLAGELHDLGKITIPLDILNKPGSLTDAEYRLIQEHVIKSYDIIKGIEFPFSLAETIYQHHERLNGSGYPRGLKEGDITVEARILAVSDVLESMTAFRPYRTSLGLPSALRELQEGSGTKYDTAIVEAVSHLIQQGNGAPFWDKESSAA